SSENILRHAQFQNRFRLAVTQHGHQGRIHIQEATVQSASVDAVDRAFEDRPVVSFRYLQCCFGLYALGDVTDIALNHLGSINRVDVAYKLHVNSPTVFGFKRQILVADNPLRLERTKSGPGGGNILKRADFPEFLAHELTVSIAQNTNKKRINFGNHPRIKINKKD